MNYMVKVFFVLFITLISLIFVNTTSAHPGNTAADGCHYCRTNCDRWGESWNTRHCHNSHSKQQASTNYKTKTNDEDNTLKYVLGAGGIGVAAYLLGKHKR
jgi:hypothetical protein